MKKAIIGNTVVFSFEGLEPLTMHCDMISPEVRGLAIPMAFSHRLGDMAAIPKADSKGRVIVVTEKMRRDAVLAGITHYESGAVNWDIRGDRTVFNPQIATIAAARNIPYAEAQIWYADHELAVLAALKAIE